MQEKLVVRKDGMREVATVTETEADGDLAYVVGDSIEGWVEVPENPKSPDYALLCDECGHIETREVHGVDTEVLVDAKHHVCTQESNAKLLAHIHEAKRPTHNPRVEDVAPSRGVTIDSGEAGTPEQEVAS